MNKYAVSKSLLLLKQNVIMEQILSLMAFLGAFTFLAMGLCLANSIEAKESEKTANIMLIIMILGIASFLIGFFGLFIVGILF